MTFSLDRCSLGCIIFGVESLCLCNVVIGKISVKLTLTHLSSLTFFSVVTEDGEVVNQHRLVLHRSAQQCHLPFTGLFVSLQKTCMLPQRNSHTRAENANSKLTHLAWSVCVTDWQLPPAGFPSQCGSVKAAVLPFPAEGLGPMSEISPVLVNNF